MSNFTVNRQRLTLSNDTFVRTPLKTEGILRGAYNAARGLAGVQDTQHGGSVGHAFGGWVRKKLNIGGAGDDAEHARLNKIDPKAAEMRSKLRGSQEREKLLSKFGAGKTDTATGLRASAGQSKEMGKAKAAYDKAQPPKPAAPAPSAAPTPAAPKPAMPPVAAPKPPVSPVKPAAPTVAKPPVKGPVASPTAPAAVNAVAKKAPPVGTTPYLDKKSSAPVKMGGTNPIVSAASAKAKIKPVAPTRSPLAHLKPAKV